MSAYYASGIVLVSEAIAVNKIKFPALGGARVLVKEYTQRQDTKQRSQGDVDDGHSRVGGESGAVFSQLAGEAPQKGII